MSTRRWLGSIVVALGIALPAAHAGVKEDRAEVRKATDKVLSTLYAAQPSAKRAVEGAAGHAVFSNFGMKILVVGGGKGRGVAVDHKSGKQTYMRMAEVQAGVGVGAKKFGVVFVFDNPQALDSFINAGWEFGGQATAAAKMGAEGAAYQGAMSVSPGVWMYQVTDTGLAAEITAKGTKYYKDDKLN
jgi:lipid-binding SYLF domain-containing protein